MHKVWFVTTTFSVILKELEVTSMMGMVNKVHTVMVFTTDAFKNEYCWKGKAKNKCLVSITPPRHSVAFHFFQNSHKLTQNYTSSMTLDTVSSWHVNCILNGYFFVWILPYWFLSNLTMSMTIIIYHSFTLKWLFLF